MKRAFKLRRLIVDDRPGWAIAWWHWCKRYRQPGAYPWGQITWHRCSRYMMVVFTDDSVRYIDADVRCERCGSRGKVPWETWQHVRNVSKTVETFMRAVGRGDK